MSNLNLDALKSTNTAASVGTGYDLAKQIRLEIDLFARESISILASLGVIGRLSLSALHGLGRGGAALFIKTLGHTTLPIKAPKLTIGATGSSHRWISAYG